MKVVSGACASIANPIFLPLVFGPFHFPREDAVSIEFAFVWGDAQRGASFRLIFRTIDAERAWRL